MTATPLEPTVGVPPGVPQNMIAPTGNVPAIGIGTTQDYPRLVFSAPYFETVAIADVIEPSVMEAVENVLPSLIPPYVDAAVLAGIQQYAVLLTGSTMGGPLFLSPLMPTADSQAATKAYVDAMVATAGIPEVPPVPVGQVWARETGQWVPIDQSGGNFLPLAGGSMQGIINMSGNTITNMAAVPALPNGAAPAQWVLNQIASVSLYQGTWDADTNAPDLTQLSVRVNGYTWIAITTSVSGVVVAQPIPGLQGLTVYNGDTIIYSTVQGQFTAIHAGGLTLPEADARYVQLAGSQMSGALLLNENATQNMQAVTYQQLEAAVANTVTPDAPADGQAYLRVGVGANRWVPGLPLAGGILTGALTLAGPGASGNNAVTVTQLNSAVTAATAGLLPIAGGTMTGPIVLAGNATTNLNPVPLQQLNAMIGSYLPLSGGAVSGNLAVGGTLAVTGGVTFANNFNIGTGIQFVAATGLIQTGGQINAANAVLDVATVGGVTFAGGGNVSSSGTLSFNDVNGNNASLTIATIGGVTFAGGGAANSTGTLSFTNVTGSIGSIGGVTFPTPASGNMTAPGAISAGTVNTTYGNVGSEWLPSGNNAQSCGNTTGQAWFQCAAYNFPNPSDPRLKKNIEAAPPGALDKVRAIPVHTFCYDLEGALHPEQVHHGFDASEVEAHHPNAVMPHQADDMLAINLPDMIAILWQAVQELEVKVNA